MNINDLLTENQRYKIVELILKNDEEYSNLTNSHQNLFYNNYAYNRNSHQHTYAIISAFNVNTEINGLKIKEINYGLHSKMVQPELYNEKIIMHIYSKDSDTKSKIKKEYCRRYNSNNNPPIYAYILFTRGKNGRIKNIELQLLDSNANQTESFIMYEKLKLHKSA